MSERGGEREREGEEEGEGEREREREGEGEREREREKYRLSVYDNVVIKDDEQKEEKEHFQLPPSWVNPLTISPKGITIFIY